MKVYKQPGEVIELVAPATVASGDGALVGSIFGVAQKAYTSGETGSFLIGPAVCEFPKAAVAATQGAIAYWDNSAKKVTTSSSGNTKIGIFTTASTSGETTSIPVRLNGAF